MHENKIMFDPYIFAHHTSVHRFKIIGLIGLTSCLISLYKIPYMVTSKMSRLYVPQAMSMLACSYQNALCMLLSLPAENENEIIVHCIFSL